jgi:hypothetical protein
MAVSATLETTRLAVTPGSEVSLELRVRNTGNVVDVLTVEVIGDAAAWSTVLPDRVSLFPGGDATVTVVFRPPMAADGPAGEVPFGLRVRSQENPDGVGGSVVEEGVLDVAPFLAVDAELQPRTCRGRKSSVTSLAISNRGTRPVTVEVVGVDPDANVIFDPDPASLTVDPDSAAYVKVKLRAAHPFRKGFPQTRQFVVHVTESGSAPAAPLAVAAGMFVQEETIPRWVRRAVLWTLIGLLLFLAFWFALGKPAVQSAAKEAAREELTPSTIAQTSSSGSTKSGSGSGASGSGASGSGADVSTTPGAAGATSTIDGRLFLTGAGTTAYEVPSGSTLQVTDIVLQNPGGDAGSLQIRRDGTALLVVELANFRDLDYHFVAPIVFTAGQKLELSADCTAGPCTPGAYFAGYVVKG